MKTEITRLEVILYTFIIVFCVGVCTEIVNWQTGDLLWTYNPQGMVGRTVIFGSVTIGVLLGWMVVAIISAMAVLILSIMTSIGD